jgi:hypothetical protein
MYESLTVTQMLGFLKTALRALHFFLNIGFKSNIFKSLNETFPQAPKPSLCNIKGEIAQV